MSGFVRVGDGKAGRRTAGPAVEESIVSATSLQALPQRRLDLGGSKNVG
jgi:hypothetical protein